MCCHNSCICVGLFQIALQAGIGIFVGLTIVTYFYNLKIKYEKIKRIKRIRQGINELKEQIMSDKKDLEHEILELKINKIAYENSLNNKAVIVQLNSEFEVVNLRLDNINKSVDQTNLKLDDFIVATNEEIKGLKKEIEPLKLMKKIPKWGYILAFIGLTVTLNFKQLMAWINKLLPW
jgi:hypothetical protein